MPVCRQIVSEGSPLGEYMRSLAPNGDEREDDERTRTKKSGYFHKHASLSKFWQHQMVTRLEYLVDILLRNLRIIVLQSFAGTAHETDLSIGNKSSTHLVSSGIYLVAVMLILSVGACCIKVHVFITTPLIAVTLLTLVAVLSIWPIEALLKCRRATTDSAVSELLFILQMYLRNLDKIQMVLRGGTLPSRPTPFLSTLNLPRQNPLDSPWKRVKKAKEDVVHIVEKFNDHLMNSSPSRSLPLRIDYSIPFSSRFLNELIIEVLHDRYSEALQQKLREICVMESIEDRSVGGYRLSSFISKKSLYSFSVNESPIFQKLYEVYRLLWKIFKFYNFLSSLECFTTDCKRFIENSQRSLLPSSEMRRTSPECSESSRSIARNFMEARCNLSALRSKYETLLYRMWLAENELCSNEFLVLLTENDENLIDSKNADSKNRLIDRLDFVLEMLSSPDGISQPSSSDEIDISGIRRSVEDILEQISGKATSEQLSTQKCSQEQMQTVTNKVAPGNEPQQRRLEVPHVPLHFETDNDPCISTEAVEDMLLSGQDADCPNILDVYVTTTVPEEHGNELKMYSKFKDDIMSNRNDLELLSELKFRCSLRQQERRVVERLRKLPGDMENDLECTEVEKEEYKVDRNSTLSFLEVCPINNPMLTTELESALSQIKGKAGKSMIGEDCYECDD